MASLICCPLLPQGETGCVEGGRLQTDGSRLSVWPAIKDVYLRQSFSRLTMLHAKLFPVPVEGEELSKEMKEHGYPRQHRHKLACLRQELIEAFVE